jgi:hypothetical protein
MRTSLRTALLVALAVIGIVTVAPAHAESSPSAYGSRLVALINDARAQHGLRALTVTSGTSTVAVNWTQHLASAGSLSHNPNLGPQLEAHGSPSWTTYGENVGDGPASSADSLFKAYMSSTEHRDNILGSRYRYLGVGVVFSGSTAWNTLDFVDQYGSSSSSPSTTASSRPSAPRVTHHATVTKAPAAPRAATRTVRRAPVVVPHVAARPLAARPVAHPKRVAVRSAHSAKPAAPSTVSVAAAAAAPVAAAPAAAVLPAPLRAPSPRPMLPTMVAAALVALLAGAFGRAVVRRGA